MTHTLRARLAAEVTLPVLAAFVFAVATRAEIIEQILVKVNGEIFTKTDLETRQVAALRQRGQPPEDAQLRRTIDEITPQILAAVVDEMLIIQRGTELGYKLGDEQFKTAVESIKKDNKLESDEQFQAALKQENVTMTDLRRNLERQMIISRVEQNEVFGKIAATESEARGYYDAHLSEFTTPPTVTLREILVSVPSSPQGVNVAQDDAAKEKADEIRARVTSGESFEKLAAELSDAPSHANAGLIGPISAKDLSPDFQSLVATMKPGDLTPPIRSQRGYQILKLESSTGAQTMPFERARDQIGERVFTDKRQAEFKKYVEKLRREAIIEWKNADVKKAYEQGLAEQAKGTTD